MPDFVSPVTGAPFNGDLRFPPSSGGDPELAVGEATMDRMNVVSSSGATMTSGILRLNSFVARRSETINSVRLLTGSTPAGAAPTLIRCGIYEIDGGGGGRLVASTPNDTALLAVANTPYTKALSAPWQKKAGTRYAVGNLVVTAAAAPSMAGIGLATAVAAELLLLPWEVASLAGQADLPASFTYGQLSATGATAYTAVIP